MKDPVEWAKAVAVLVKDYVLKETSRIDRLVESVLLRLTEVNNRLDEFPQGKEGPKGDAGPPGINAYEVAVSLGFQGDVNDWMATFRGMRGEKGDPGADADMQVLRDEAARNIQDIFAEFLNSVELPKDGKDGKSVTIEDMRALFESEQAKWALDFERRAQDVLRGMGEKIPIPKDGKDGVGFDDLDVVHDGERDFKFAFRQGERVKEFQFTVPALIERGVYKPDTQYKKGDGVTYGGSYWIALVDTMQKPGEGKDWRLAVKKGRDGRDGEKGERGPEGPKGKDGGKL